MTAEVINVLDLTLQNAGGGKLADNFEAAQAAFWRLIEQEVDALNEGGAFVRKDGALEMSFSAKVTIRYTIENGACMVVAETTERLPARKAGTQSVRVRDGRFLIEADDVQLAFIRASRPAHNEGG